MDRYQLVLARLEQEEAAQWEKLAAEIEDSESSFDDEREFLSLNSRLEKYKLARQMLFEVRAMEEKPKALGPDCGARSAG